METNFTNKNKFRIIIHNLLGKELEFFAKAVQFGGVSVGVTNVPTPVKNYKISGSSRKDKFSIFITNAKISPPSWQPKQ